MNSLVAAASLVPSRPKNSINSLEREVESMSLTDLLSTLVLPKDTQDYAINLTGVVQHFKKRSVPPLKEITTGVIETFREFQELNQKVDEHQSTGIHILRRIARWGFTRIVKWLFKFAFRMMYRVVHWVFKKIIVNGVKALVEWVVRPILMEALGAIGFNPELWPFIAVAGGATALGYSAWNMFFGKPADAKIPTVAAQVQSTLKEQEDILDDLGEIPLAPEQEDVPFDTSDSTIPISTITTVQSLLQAQAPIEIGAPVAAAPPKSDAANLAEARAAAKESEKKYGIPASVTLAQWGLESNYGRSMPQGSNNPFGIKARSGAPYVESMTNEFIGGRMQRVSQKFAKYNSISEAFDAYARLLATGKPYAEARTHLDDPKAFADAVARVYATDPQYGSKLKSVMTRLGVDKPSTQVTTIAVRQVPGITIDNAQPSATTSESTSTVPLSSTSRKIDKTYLNGPNKSIVAIS